MFQSSPTPKGGRYGRATRGGGGGHAFQSSPTPKGGRYEGHAYIKLLFTGFNPRPPRKVGATWADALPGLANLVFQSSPTPKGGRYSPTLAPGPVDICFNPRPPRKVGATPGLPLVAGPTVVSILAHPERWALPPVNHKNTNHAMFQSSPTPKGGRYRIRGTPGRPMPRFNPRPPRKVGATWPGPWSCQPIGKVSILAHPERWALL